MGCHSVCAYSQGLHLPAPSLVPSQLMPLSHSCCGREGPEERQLGRGGGSGGNRKPVPAIPCSQDVRGSIGVGEASGPCGSIYLWESWVQRQAAPCWQRGRGRRMGGGGWRLGAIVGLWGWERVGYRALGWSRAARGRGRGRAGRWRRRRGSRRSRSARSPPPPSSPSAAGSRTTGPPAATRRLFHCKQRRRNVLSLLAVRQHPAVPPTQWRDCDKPRFDVCCRPIAIVTPQKRLVLSNVGICGYNRFYSSLWTEPQTSPFPVPLLPGTRQGYSGSTTRLWATLTGGIKADVAYLFGHMGSLPFPIPSSIPITPPPLICERILTRSHSSSPCPISRAGGSLQRQL